MNEMPISIVKTNIINFCRINKKNVIRLPTYGLYQENSKELNIKTFFTRTSHHKIKEVL